jgi:hypothetical protein
MFDNYHTLSAVHQQLFLNIVPIPDPSFSLSINWVAQYVNHVMTAIAMKGWKVAFLLHVASALMATLLSIAAGLASRDTRLVMREVLLHFAIIDTYFGDEMMTGGLDGSEISIT